MNARSRPLSSRSAFSLIEVMLAMGVMTFALVTAVEVIPIGLTTLRQAMDDTVEAQIVRSIGAKALVTPYSQLATAFSGTQFYFDDEGTLLTNSPASRPASARYTASASLVTPSFPGSESSSAAVTNGLWTLRVQLTAQSAGAGATTNLYSIQSPNSGS